MSVVLESIKLNHDPASAHSDALNIRKDATTFVDVPEWRRGYSSRPEDSPAAYSISVTRSQAISIQARFRTTSLSPDRNVEVRAIDPSNPAVQGCLYAILRRLGTVPTIPPPYGNCLGAVKARSVSFETHGMSGYETFELEPIWSPGTFGQGIYIVTWQWQYRLEPSDPWQDIERTQHRIYLVLDMPNAPWQQTPYDSTNLQLPWTAALDKACLWAAGAQTLDASAAAITERVNLHPLQSYTPATMFGYSSYHLSTYLNMLDGGSPFQLNCTDCADAVTTLANLLGCKLVEGRFFDMQTRKFLTLNGNPSQEASWVSWGWSYHEICWLENIAPDGLIYDGCLQVDMDDNYTDTVHATKHPIKMRFGQNDPQDYRYRLVESGSAHLENTPRHRTVQ